MWRQSKIGRGYIDQMVAKNDGLFIAGWLLTPAGPLDKIQLFLDDEWVAEQAPLFRSDIGIVMDRVPESYWSGFRFHVKPSSAQGIVEVRGRRGWRKVSGLRSTYRMDTERILKPPLHLVRRITASTSLMGYYVEGMRLATEFTETLRRHRKEPVKRLLDWGCGCGRVSVHLLADRIAEEHYGCDIDEEATAWCAANLLEGTFQGIPPEPPTSYPDAFFDAIIGYSVLTHLNEEMQRRWLAELHRVLTPGGLALVTVHGDYLGFFEFPRPKKKLGTRIWSHIVGRLETIPEPGFIDARADPFLDGVAPPGYYRDVFQSRRYTEREYSKLFEILEYREGGQDLVVLRRPS